VSLTEKKIRKLITAGERARVADSGPNGTKGLYLCVDSERAASWCFRFQLGGRSRWMGLGSARDFSLAEARARAREQRQRLADKIDPLSARRAERAGQAARTTITFAEAAEQWHTMMSPKWSSARHTADVYNRLRRWTFPIIGKTDVAALETQHVLKVLQQEVDKDEQNFWTAHAVLAARLRADVEQILDWAAVGQYRSTTAPNPARWNGHLALLLPAPRSVAPTKRHVALPYKSVPMLMSKLAKHQGVTAKALMFLILSAARLGEAVNATWDEIDFDENLWVVPASRMKARREWRQPLAPQIIELLKNLPTELNNKYLFIGREGTKLSQDALRQVLRREGYGDVTLHGFRSSFADFSHERTSHTGIVVEMSLAHSVGSQTERSYRRSDLIQKRRALMNEWAKFCLTPPAAAPKADQKVVPIGARR
jgi:integrase